MDGGDGGEGHSSPTGGLFYVGSVNILETTELYYLKTVKMANSMLHIFYHNKKMFGK